MIEIPNQLIANLTVHKGDDSIRRRIKWTQAETDNIPFFLDHGYGVLHAIVLQHLRRTLPFDVSESISDQQPIKLRPTLAAAHTKFILLCENLFQESISRVFSQAVISQRQEAANVRIPLVVYIAERVACRQRSTVVSARRATVRRMESARDDILESIDQNPPDFPSNARVGDLSQNVWALSIVVGSTGPFFGLLISL